MAFYPINVQRFVPYYNGEDRKRIRKYERDMRIAERIERYLNGQMETTYREKASMFFTFGSIACRVCADERVVRRLLRGFSDRTDNSIALHRDDPDDGESASFWWSRHD